MAGKNFVTRAKTRRKEIKNFNFNYFFHKKKKKEDRYNYYS